MQAQPIAAALLAGLAGVAFATEPPRSAPEALYTLSVQTAPPGNGKPLTVTIRETKRAQDFSLVEVESASAGDESSLLYLARGLCGVMRARKQKIAVAEQIQFRLSFPKTAKVEETKGLPRIVLSESDCARLE